MTITRVLNIEDTMTKHTGAGYVFSDFSKRAHDAGWFVCDGGIEK